VVFAFAMSDAMTIATGGLQTAFSRFNGAASKLLDAQRQNGDMASQVVTLKQAEIGARADLMVLKTAEGMQKSLLDILA
jgi:hypothetical protein